MRLAECINLSDRGRLSASARSMPFEEILDVHVTSLTGLGASYRITGFFKLKADESNTVRINFKGVAFGGHYGGHNVNIEISKQARRNVMAARQCKESEVDDIISEVQRRLLNGEMVVEYDKLKPEGQDSLGNLTA